MIIFPAIDLLSGNCVRLVRGEYSTAHRVAEDPVKTAEAFAAAGAEYLHLVDLDGAKNGKAKEENRAAVKAVIAATGMPAELGGGIRTLQDISSALEAGVSRVILGSAAADPDFLASACREFGDKIALGLDAKDGFAAFSGWTDSSKLYYLDFAASAAAVGVKTIIFTDISRDGTLSGPNLSMLQTLSEAVDANITASGGIRDLSDIIALRKLGLYGAICGKSLYAGTLDLAAAIKEGALCSPKE